MEISDTYGFSAPAEVVFHVMTDPDRVDRWLPDGITAELVEADQVRVRDGSDARDYQIFRAPADLRLEWWAARTPELRGTAQVRDTPGGGSEVRVRVDVPADGERIRKLVVDAVTGLRAEVDDNFNTG